jgi:hypothetical protein
MTAGGSCTGSRSRTDRLSGRSSSKSSHGEFAIVRSRFVPGERRWRSPDDDSYTRAADGDFALRRKDGDRQWHTTSVFAEVA